MNVFHTSVVVKYEPLIIEASKELKKASSTLSSAATTKTALAITRTPTSNMILAHLRMQHPFLGHKRAHLI